MAASVVPRVGIVGGGLSGLATAAILGNTLKDKIAVTVFERATANRDEGYGLDLDYENGQEALKQAGVYDQYWNISRPYSDTFMVTDLRLRPLFTKFPPHFLRAWLPSRMNPEPESNRAMLRNLFLDSMSNNGVEMLYSHAGVDVRPNDGRADVISRDGDSLGTFDLVIDATGVHSPLRHLRVNDDVGEHYTGSMILHGVINDTDSVLPEHVLSALHEGSLMCISRGYFFCIQRYMPDLRDRSAAFFYQVMKEDENEIFNEIGIEQTKSRADGILSDKERLTKVKDWLHQDIGDREWVDPGLHAMIDAIDRVTIRGSYSHGDDTTLKSQDELEVPIVCVGDSLRNIGLGGGGNLALQDALEVCRALISDDGFDDEGRPNMEALHTIEEGILKRKREFVDQRQVSRKMLLARPDDATDPNLSLRQLAAFAGWPKLGYILQPLANIWQSWYMHDRHYNQLGTPKPPSE